MAKARDYDKEYAQYHGTPEHIRERAQRNAARAEVVKTGRAHKGDGKNVDHVKPIRSGGGNAMSNLRVESESKNKAWRRGKKGKL